MDAAARSLALSRHGVDLTVEFEGRYPPDAPAYDVATRCTIAGGASAQRVAALADLQNFTAPAPTRAIEAWLAELSVLTAGRGREGFDAELMVTAYSGRLGRYPADVVRAALLDHSWKWFPAWAELEAVCDAKAAPRWHMLAALATSEPDPEPERRRPTEAERARIQEMIDEKFSAAADQA